MFTNHSSCHYKEDMKSPLELCLVCWSFVSPVYCVDSSPCLTWTVVESTASHANAAPRLARVFTITSLG